MSKTHDEMRKELEDDLKHQNNGGQLYPSPIRKAVQELEKSKKSLCCNASIMVDGKCSMCGKSKQVGGSHYSKMAIEPVDFITKNNIGFLEGNAIKYICRHESKNGVEDIEKAIHYLEMILEKTYKINS